MIRPRPSTTALKTRAPVDAVVSDPVRVSAAISFWKSRFNRQPTEEEISRLTGFSQERLDVALGRAPKPSLANRRRKPLDVTAGAPRPYDVVTEFRPVKPKPEKTQRLLCVRCLNTWDRPAVRGRKPSVCPKCSS